jgi:predicted nucleotidyltransferase
MRSKKVCDTIVKLLAEKVGVVAIFNNGSSVVGMDAPGSDLDFVIILKNNKDKKNILRILRKTFRVLKNEEHPEINVEEQFDVGSSRADFAFISEKDMRRKVNNFYKSKENFLEFQHFISLPQQKNSSVQ